MGLLEFSKALKTYNKKYEALKISPDEVMNEAKLYFDLLRAWMENPTLIGGPKARDRGSGWSRTGGSRTGPGPNKFQNQGPDRTRTNKI